MILVAIPNNSIIHLLLYMQKIINSNQLTTHHNNHTSINECIYTTSCLVGWCNNNWQLQTSLTCNQNHGLASFPLTTHLYYAGLSLQQNNLSNIKLGADQGFIRSVLMHYTT